MALQNVEITISDSEWPYLTLVCKAGTRVQKETAPHDVAPTKFEPIINNFMRTITTSIIERRKATHGNAQ